MDRQVIEYYPEWLREFREIKVLSKLQQTQSEKLWNCLQSIIDNNFLETLDEYGCSKWEKALELQVKEGMTIEERRANIIGRHLEERPFTVTKFKNMLNALCGDGEYILNITSSTYTVVVSLRLDKKDQKNAILKLMSRVLPANMLYSVDIMYNEYSIFKTKKYGELKNYTYAQLREDSFS